MFKLLFTEQAAIDLKELQTEQSLLRSLKSVRKALAYLQTNPRHPSLNTHKCSAIAGIGGEEIFEAYAENKTPTVYKIFWHYGPNKDNIMIIAITPHP